MSPQAKKPWYAQAAEKLGEAAGKAADTADKYANRTRIKSKGYPKLRDLEAFCEEARSAGADGGEAIKVGPHRLGGPVMEVFVDIDAHPRP